MESPHDLERRLAHTWPLSRWWGVTTVVAVSGGADSVALLRALVAIRRSDPASGPGGRLVVGHFNHALRGQESETDQEFVEQLGQQLDVHVELGRAQDARPGPIPSHGGDGLEAHARELRYRFLRQVADRFGARYLVTAHTADDQAETILHRILRGTGLGGLAGIPATRPLSELTTIVRPLLTVSRDEALGYLQDLGQSFRRDSTNGCLDFTRNRIRHELIPYLRESFNPRISEALVRLGQLADQTQAVVQAVVEPLVEACTQGPTGADVVIDCQPLRNQPPHIVRELFMVLWKKQRWPQQAMTSEKWEELAQMTLQPIDQPQTANLPGNILAQRRLGFLELRKAAPDIRPSPF